MGGVLIYGSYGYSGSLIVKELLKSNPLFPIILSGRSLSLLSAQAHSHSLPCIPFTLTASTTPQDISEQLFGKAKNVKVFLNCAGPFKETAKVFGEACIQSSIHYLDITGEPDVFQALSLLDDTARNNGVMLLPGVGFDVVPSDCLLNALSLAFHEKYSSPPDSLEMLMGGTGDMGLSRGTALTIVAHLNDGGVVCRENDELATYAFGKVQSNNRELIPKGKTGLLMSWGDIVTAHHSTKVPNIHVYIAIHPLIALFLGYFYWLFDLLIPFIQPIASKAVQAWVKGPTAEQRDASRMVLKARASKGSNALNAKLVVLEGYNLTALTAADIVKRAVNGEIQVGFNTPATVYGSDYILSFPSSKLTME